MILVIAGNHRQYIGYIKKNKLNPKDAIYIHCEMQLLGIYKAKIVRYGTWWQNPIVDSVSLKMIEAENDK